MHHSALGNVESSRTSSATPPPEEPPDFRRITRMQTRAAREEMLRRMQSPTEIQEELIILPTRYPIRRQAIPIVEYIAKAPVRKPKTKGKSRNSSKPPVTPECEDDQQMCKPAPVARKQPRSKNKRVQTEHSVSEKEMNLIELLRARRIDIEKIKIICNGNEHIIKEDDGTDAELEEIDRSVHNIPMPPIQVPIQQRTHHNFLRQMFHQDIARHFLTSQYENGPVLDINGLCHNYVNKTVNYLRSATYYTNSQFHNNPPNFNQYGLPRWCPRSNYYQHHHHTSWGA